MNAQTAVQRLISSGMTESAIAAKVNCSQPTIHRLKHGIVGARGTSYELASALIDLASDLDASNDEYSDDIPGTDVVAVGAQSNESQISD